MIVALVKQRPHPLVAHFDPSSGRRNRDAAHASGEALVKMSLMVVAAPASNIPGMFPERARVLVGAGSPSSGENGHLRVAEGRVDVKPLLETLFLDL